MIRRRLGRAGGRRDGLDGAARDLVAHALRYPFDRVRGSYALVDGEPLALPARELRALGDGGTPVLAYGANAAPERLGAKLRRLGDGAGVPVIAAELDGLDVVYSAHVSPYGAIPGTLQDSPGTTVAVHVLMLSGEQIAALDRTEPNYALARVRGVRCRLDTGEQLDEVHAYVSRHGALVAQDTHVAVAGIPARDRRFPEAEEARILGHARDRLDPGADLHAWVLEAIRDPDTARIRTGELKRDARPFAWRAWEPVPRYG